MKVRITFRSEVTISGRNEQEIREKWESMQLYPDTPDAPEFIDIDTVEDAETFEDIDIDLF